MSNVIRVVIADDQTLIREGVVNLLRKEVDLEVVGEADSSQDVISVLRVTCVDVLLLTPVMPKMNNLRLLILLLEKCHSFMQKNRTVPCLSQRETEIARHVATGCSNRDIADQLSISEKTVKTHLANIFKKLRLRHRLDLALSVRQWEASFDD